MALPPNIDRFNKTTLLVFDKLYAAFPVPITLDSKRIAMETLPIDASFDDSFESIEPVFYTIEFLKKEGLIEYSGKLVDGTEFVAALLTSKGLAVLGQTPKAIGPHTSLSDSIRDIVKDGLKGAGSEAAKKAVGLIFSYATKAAPVVESVGGMVT